MALDFAMTERDLRMDRSTWKSWALQNGEMERIRTRALEVRQQQHVAESGFADLIVLFCRLVSTRLPRFEPAIAGQIAQCVAQWEESVRTWRTGSAAR